MIRASLSPPQGGFRLSCVLITLASVFALAACSQPDDAATEQAAAETAAPAAASGEVTSVDADGNVAPFGMASREPVEVPPLESAATVAAAAPEDEGGTVADSSTFRVQCAGCHGVDAGGFGGSGVNLLDSELVANASASELIEFVKAGRMPDSPDSISGVPMPGFAWMPEDQLREVVLYIKQLQ